MDNSLLYLYNKGFLPGPKETKEQFFNRMATVQKILKSPHFYLQKGSLAKKKFIPFYECSLLEIGSLNLFFHGSSTSIYEVEKGINFPIISSPSKFSKLFVKEDEILLHELVHARRCQFDESKYEEILAYRTSSSPFRKKISPILNSNFDLIFFFLAILTSLISPIPIALVIGFFSSRLYFRHRTINKCIKYLKARTPYYENILNGMTDEEIILLSRGEIGKIDFSLYRWQFLQQLFWNKL